MQAATANPLPSLLADDRLGSRRPLRTASRAGLRRRPPNAGKVTYEAYSRRATASSSSMMDALAFMYA